MTDRPLDVQAVAGRLGVKVDTVWKWRIRESSRLPPEDGTVSGQPWWWPETIDTWAMATGRVVCSPEGGEGMSEEDCRKCGHPRSTHACTFTSLRCFFCGCNGEGGFGTAPTPAVMTPDHLTDEELAEMASHEWSGQPDVPRLIAALRASRQREAVLTAKVASERRMYDIAKARADAAEQALAADARERAEQR